MFRHVVFIEKPDALIGGQELGESSFDGVPVMLCGKNAVGYGSEDRIGSSRDVFPREKNQIFLMVNF